MLVEWENCELVSWNETLLAGSIIGFSIWQMFVMNESLPSLLFNKHKHICTFLVLLNSFPIFSWSLLHFFSRERHCVFVEILTGWIKHYLSSFSMPSYYPFTYEITGLQFIDENFHNLPVPSKNGRFNSWINAQHGWMTHQ